MKKKTAVALLTGAFFLCSGALAADDNTKLFGYTDGAEVMEINIENKVIIDSASDIIYKRVSDGHLDTRQLRMDILSPHTPQAKPCIVYFPGGGFFSANYKKFTEMKMALAKAGFVVASAEYRVIPSMFPALIEDAKAAVRYLKANAEALHIDPEKIGVLGDSAGGYIAEFLDTTSGTALYDTGDNLNVSSSVAAAVSMYGLSDLSCVGDGYDEAVVKIHQSNNVTEALLLHGFAFDVHPGGTILTDPEKTREASPISYADGKKPPLLLCHGSGDKLVSTRQSAKLYEALKAKGSDVKYLLVKDAGHGDLPWFQEPFIKRVVDFFTEKLGLPQDNSTANETML